MPKRVLILGAGTAGTIMANRLSRSLPAEWEVMVVDRDDAHIYQPGLLFVPFNLYKPHELVRPRRSFLSPEVKAVQGEVETIDVDEKVVLLRDGTPIGWDLLIVATGSRVARESLTGLTDSPGWREDRTDFYELDGAVAARGLLDKLRSGRLLVHLHDMPIKCPVAPLEFAFLAEAWLTQQGRREDVSITYVTPLDGAFTKPAASRALGGLLESRGIELVTDFAAERVEGEGRQLVSYDGRALDYDLLITTPLHRGDAAVDRSGLGDDLGFLPTDKHTLQSKVHPDVFALGDCTDLPTSKAGSVAHFQAEVLTENILRHVEGLSPLPEFDGHANCFIETGHEKAILIDFNYDTEPLPGRFPMPGLGPFTLLEESHVNHWGKLGFRWMYWSQLLAGKDLPIDHRMLMAGKWSA
ncbi:MAG: NAD(P)/FAD-dependent oxidoreductase [Alphaproteobacteria bacterium]|nr:NAD(P)/FAD-dependent oxidoreductase [Alphaproteobacteria bacterium]